MKGLPVGFSAQERGNVLLTVEDGPSFNAFVRGEGNVWTEVTWYPDNYPAFGIAVFEATEAAIVRNINLNHKGKVAGKCNIGKSADYLKKNGIYIADDATRCFRVEYDLKYTGGNYSSVGEFAYIPFEWIEENNPIGGLRIAEAFKELTGIDPIHIINYNLDESYDEYGNPWEQ